MSDRDALRATLEGFDDRRKKIVGGLIAVMIENPDRVKEREWIAEQFTQIVILACDFEDISSTNEGLEHVQAYVRENVDPILSACYQLFAFVAEDLAPRMAEGITREHALAQALGYMLKPPTT